MRDGIRVVVGGQNHALTLSFSGDTGAPKKYWRFCAHTQTPAAVSATRKNSYREGGIGWTRDGTHLEHVLLAGGKRAGLRVEGRLVLGGSHDVTTVFERG